jgi:hypothetical protein
MILFVKKYIKKYMLIVIMMFTCDSCGFETKHQTNYYRHKKSIKHIENCPNDKPKIDIIEKHESTLHKCKLCHGLFNDDIFVDHVEICVKHSNYDEIKLKLTASEKRIIELSDKLEASYIENNKNLKSTVNDAKIVVNSTIKYLRKNYNNAPMADRLENYNLEKDKHQFTKDLVFHSKKSKSDEFLGTYLAKLYEVDDPALRVFWNTDSDRLTYLFRGSIKIKNKTYKVEWLTDKKGAKVREKIIRPFLQDVKKILNDKLKHITAEDIMLDTLFADHLGRITLDIESQKLEKDVLRFISPFFHFDKNLLDEK